MLKKNKKKWKEKIDWRAEIPLLFLFSLGCLLFISLVFIFIGCYGGCEIVQHWTNSCYGLSVPKKNLAE